MPSLSLGWSVQSLSNFFHVRNGGIERNGSLEVHPGLGGFVQFEIDESKHAMSAGIGFTNRKRLEKLIPSFRELIFFVSAATEPVSRGGRARIQFEGFQILAPS